MILEACDERPNILEGSTSHDFGVLVLKETEVKILKVGGSLIDLRLFSELCHDISTSLADFFFLILGKGIFVKWEKPLLEAVK